MQGRDRRHGRHGERKLDPAPSAKAPATASRRLGSVILVGDERYSFSVVEESLTTETIAEYRRSRTPHGPSPAGDPRDSRRLAATDLTPREGCGTGHREALNCSRAGRAERDLPAAMPT